MDKLIVSFSLNENNKELKKKYLPNSILFSDRLVLKPLSIGDADSCFLPLLDLSIYNYIPESPPDSLEELVDDFENVVSNNKDKTSPYSVNWVIRFSNQENCVGLIDVTFLSDSEVEIGVLIFPKYWKKGIGKEACAEVVEYLFCDLGITRVIANVNAFNEASIGLLKSLGFIFMSGYYEEKFKNGMSRRGYRYEFYRKWKN